MFLQSGFVLPKCINHDHHTDGQNGVAKDREENGSK